MTELNIEKERREFEAAINDMPPISEEDMIEICGGDATSFAFTMWLLAKRAAVGSAEPVRLHHMAVAENGVLRWMTGRKINDCELYAMPHFGNAPLLYTAPPAPVSAEPVLMEVWYGSMPESNGRSNFTAILRRKGASMFDTDGFTIARSEYPERVRYDADCVRYLIGEIDKKPFILDYDGDKHSGYVAPPSTNAKDSDKTYVISQKMINAGMKWLIHFQHMRKGDKESALTEAYKAMVSQQFHDAAIAAKETK